MRFGLSVSGLLLTVTAGLAGCGGGGSGAAVTQSPVAVVTQTPTSGTAPLSITFDASRSTDPQGYALSYNWTFSDGGTATTPSVVHSYANHGSYTATVSVSNGKSTAATQTLNVTVNAAPPTVQALAMTVNVLGVAQTTATATVVASDRESLPLTYSISSPATSGTATIDAATGAISYRLAGHATQASDSFTVSVANLSGATTLTVPVTLAADPLLVNQWHLQNTGQNAFASNLPVAGNDLNVAGAWSSGYTGKGIKVGIADTGLEAAHEDLAANVDLTHSVNFLTGGTNPSPTSTGFDHGTAVAGIIGAVAFNGKGGRGVAYNATLRGYNLLNAFSVANMATSLGSATASADNDVFNLSFENSQPGLPSFSGAYQSVTNAALGLRGGLGASFINAAGNDFLSIMNGSATQCTTWANVYGVSCGDTAGDERRGGYYPLNVAALSANGLHAPYSSTGASIWISAPAGDYGKNRNYQNNYADYDPAIVTTSRSGCTNYTTAINPLDNLGANALAAQCQYTAIMNGTSSATPNVVGVVAMMLEANKSLSWRDIKYILAKTAKPVEPAFAGVTTTTLLPGSQVTLEQGWITNGGGFRFSNRYGFGALDAAAAVAMAKTYTTYLPTLQQSTGNYTFTPATSSIIPSASATGASLTWTVNETFKTLEFVVLFVNIASTPGIGCNQLELTSPSGTKSILLHAANGYTNVALNNTRFESNAFYGESVNGTWTMRILDLCAPSATRTTLSTSSTQTLTLAGH